MQVGDKVRFKANSSGSFYITNTIYTIVELEADDFVKVKHPDIGGHFHYNKKNLEIVK
jgi:hypothetical protein|tara:strand:- start:920 stop:1093 length:174 start_codon:yes stop_codon:yes gene_type:complete